MGSDIHLHTEIKVNGVWHHYSNPRISRDYDLFAKLADVRNDDEITPIAEPRGLPDDLSFTTKFDADYWGRDGHSHSWLTGKELAEALRWYDKLVVERSQKSESPKTWYSAEHEFFGYLFGNDWGSQTCGHDDCKENSALARACRAERDLQPDVEDVRCVFWFDC
jgi:hypothetical protein